MARLNIARSDPSAAATALQQHNRPSAEFAGTEEVSTSTTRGDRQLRLNLVLPAKSADRLDNLRKLTEASSYTEVIRNALRLYEGIVMEYEKGNRAQIVDKSGRPLGVSIF